MEINGWGAGLVVCFQMMCYEVYETVYGLRQDVSINQQHKKTC